MESFFKQQYTNFDISFCVGDANDASIKIVQSLINQHPNVKARLFIGQAEQSTTPNPKRVTNPKLNNIKEAYESSEAEYIWICDSRIIADDEQTLAEMVSHFENENIGLVHSLPVSISKKSDASRKSLNYDCFDHTRIRVFSTQFKLLKAWNWTKFGENLLWWLYCPELSPCSAVWVELCNGNVAYVSERFIINDRI